VGCIDTCKPHGRVAHQLYTLVARESRGRRRGTFVDPLMLIAQLSDTHIRPAGHLYQGVVASNQMFAAQE